MRPPGDRECRHDALPAALPLPGTAERRESLIGCTAHSPRGTRSIAEFLHESPPLNPADSLYAFTLPSPIVDLYGMIIDGSRVRRDQNGRRVPCCMRFSRPS